MQQNLGFARFLPFLLLAQPRGRFWTCMLGFCLSLRDEHFCFVWIWQKIQRRFWFWLISACQFIWIIYGIFMLMSTAEILSKSFWKQSQQNLVMISLNKARIVGMQPICVFSSGRKWLLATSPFSMYLEQKKTDGPALAWEAGANSTRLPYSIQLKLTICGLRLPAIICLL